MYPLSDGNFSVRGERGPLWRARRLLLAHALGACDWRRPDQDIRRLFPGADDYHPIYKRAFQRRDEIEAMVARTAPAILELLGSADSLQVLSATDGAVAVTTA